MIPADILEEIMRRLARTEREEGVRIIYTDQHDPAEEHMSSQLMQIYQYNQYVMLFC